MNIHAMPCVMLLGMEDFLDLELVALTHPDPLEQLRACRLILERLDQEALAAIEQARAEGASWEEIASTLDSQEGPQTL